MSTTIQRSPIGSTRSRNTSASARVRDASIVGAAALLVRLVWVAQFGRTLPGPNDTIFYQGAAAGLAGGNGFTTVLGEPTAHWPPGYPFLVSLVYRVFGVDLDLGLALNVVLGAATAVLLYLVAERLLGRAGGLVAGAAFAVLPSAVFMTGLFLVETTYLFALAVVLALVVFLPDRRVAPIVIGIAIGLAALTKGEGLLLAVVPLATWWGRGSRRAWLARSVALLAAVVLTIAPWTIRNQSVMGSFVPVATNPSTTLWSGHNDGATGGPTYAPPALLDRIPKGLSSQEHEVAEARLLRSEAISWAKSHPLKELELIPRKLLALNNQLSNVFPIWFNARGETQLNPPNLLTFGVIGDAGSYFLLLATLASLALIGPRRLARRHPAMRGVMAYLALSLFVFGFLYYGQWRYRIPMEPLMILLATPLLTAAWASRGALRRGVGDDPGARRAAEAPRDEVAA